MDKIEETKMRNLRSYVLFVAESTFDVRDEESGVDRK